MRYTSRIAIYLAAIWGASYALFIQRTEMGRTLAKATTWLSVVIGIGVDLIIALPIIPRSAWNTLAKIVMASSVGIISRSLVNELHAIRTVGVINASYPRQRGTGA